VRRVVWEKLREGRKALAFFARWAGSHLATAIACAILSAPGFAAERGSCRLYPPGVDADLRRIEWLEEGKWRGVKLAIPDRRWTWAIAPSAMGLSIYCSNCSQNEIGDGFLSLSLRPPGSDRADENVGPDFVAIAFWMVTGEQLVFKSASEREAVALAGINGQARAVTAERDGRPYHAVVFVAQEACMALVGIFSAKDGREVSVGDLKRMSKSIAVERFTPVLDPAKLDPLLPALSHPGLPLGDARQKAQEGKP
jgi:hypothetical protein